KIGKRPSPRYWRQSRFWRDGSCHILRGEQKLRSWAEPLAGNLIVKDCLRGLITWPQSARTWAGFF
ncbi:hypothetical protein ATANTOWER_004739, partial [Ataeniobius toweri]|nr:hypothetical protein [Ataeniobius toweri]